MSYDLTKDDEQFIEDKKAKDISRFKEKEEKNFNIFYVWDALQAIHKAKPFDDEAHRPKSIRVRLTRFKNSDHFYNYLHFLIDHGLVFKKSGLPYGNHTVSYYYITEKGFKLLDALNELII